MSKNDRSKILKSLTDKEVETVLKLHKQGKTLKQIGKAIHRSDKTVSAFIHGYYVDDEAKTKPTTKQNCCKDIDKAAKCVAKAPAKCCCRDAKKSAPKKAKGKTIPSNAVPGYDIVQIKVSDDQKKALIMASEVLALADEIGKVFANFFSKVP